MPDIGGKVMSRASAEDGSNQNVAYKRTTPNMAGTEERSSYQQANQNQKVCRVLELKEIRVQGGSQV